jgi:hypothetical protein
MFSRAQVATAQPKASYLRQRRVGLRRNSDNSFTSYETPNSHVCGGSCNLDHKRTEEFIGTVTNIASLIIPIRIKGIAIFRFGNAFKGLSLAAKYGIGEYSVLKALTKGIGVQVHHLIEERFAGLLGEKSAKMLSIVLTKAEHQTFTNAWRNEIGHNGSKALVQTGTATRIQVENAARKIYANYSEFYINLDYDNLQKSLW